MPRKKVLLADDVLLFLDFEESFFKREDVEVMVVRSGTEVLQTIAGEMPDLIFLDLHMPGMTGYECCRKIKADAAFGHIPVVMATIGGRPDDLRLCSDAGCDGIVLKPINRYEFLETARKFLNITERAVPRYAARLSIRFGKEKDHLLSDYTINLSTGGVFLETASLMPVNSPLVAEFVLPHSNKTIRCKAKVAWVNHPEEIKNPHLPVGMGIQFLDIALEDINAIRDYIKGENLLPSW
jgi:uncharacterized protein (TIGR02266 family)